MPIRGDVENIIRDFEKRQGAGMGYDTAFPKIERAVVATQLRDRIKKPEEIDQGNASLCGPAVFLYSLAKDKPKQYAQFVIGVYEKGRANLGQINVTPGGDCKAFNPALNTTNKQVPAVDWIALAGLRDSENNFLDYDDIDDQVAGITFPSEITNWFTKSGFSNVINSTNIVFDKNLYSLVQAHRQFINGANVCLFVGANLLQGIPGGRAPADHWVVLTSPIKFDGKQIDSLISKGESVNEDHSLLSKKIEFTMYTWKEKNRPVNYQDPNLTVSKFLDYYYGYVSAQ